MTSRFPTGCYTSGSHPRYQEVLVSLRENPQLANGELGQYLRKSLTYSGYRMTR